MTPISEMQAGREMDALVAEKVMGWKRCTSPMQNRDDPRLLGWDTGNPKIYGNEILPAFSTDIIGVWYVVEKLRDSGDWCCIAIRSDYSYMWRIEMTPHLSTDHQPTVVVEDEDLCLAICRAALMAVGEGR